MVWACRGTIFRPFFDHFSTIPGGPPEKYPKPFFDHFPIVGPVGGHALHNSGALLYCAEVLYDCFIARPGIVLVLRTIFQI